MLAALAAGGLSLHSLAARPPAPGVPGRLLLGSEPEPDAGPIPPGTPRQPGPALYQHRELPVPDLMLEVRRLKRRAEQFPGPVLGPAPADAARYRLLMDYLRGEEAEAPRRFPSSRAPFTPPAPKLRLASVGHSLWAEVVASPVAWGKLSLRAGHSAVLEARHIAGSPPLLYLIKDGHQVAFSGDQRVAAAAAAALTYTPAVDGDFQFLVRGPGDGGVGRCDLLLDGQLLFGGVVYGGTAVPAVWAGGDEFQTAHLPSPPDRLVDTVLYAFDGRERFVARNDDGGINGCSRLVMSSASSSPDAHVLVACASQNPADGGPVRVYANPLSRGDPDGDHLATPLEVELRTDPHSADTDGDGLRDDWEVFGVHTPDGDEDLPACSDPWSSGAAAEPTRMDLFVELDWMAGPDGDPAYFRLTDAALGRVVRAFREHGGITLHVDVGQMGARGSRGGQSFAYQPRFNFTGTQPLSMEDLWSSPAQFALSRRHLFVYGLCIDRFAPSVDTTAETRRIYENARVIGTSEVWNPRYSPGFIICNGTGIYNRPSMQASVLMHELGHCLHLRHGGNVDTNRKPNYFSVMNYLFTLPTLSDDGDIDFSRGTLAPLDETALNETAGLGLTPTDHVYRLIQGRLRADLRSGANRAAIDWNGNRRLDSGAVSADVNEDGFQAVLSDFNDWGEVKRPTRGFGWVGLNAGFNDWTSFNDAP